MQADVFGEDTGSPSDATGAPKAEKFEAEVMPSTAIESLERAQVDIQISTAKKYPRTIQRSVDKARQLACSSSSVAATCTYGLPRDGKVISGPSIRLAEIMATSWGNLTYGGRILEIGEKAVVAQGVCQDMESNVRVAVEVHRNIVTRNGRRYGDAMIQTTSQAAIAIAIRNAIFKVIPGGYVESVRRDAQRVARGEDEGLEKRRDKALAYFDRKGVAEARIYAALSEQATRALPCTGREDITWNDIDVLIAFATSLETGEATIYDLFPQVRTPVEDAKDGTISFGSKGGAADAKGSPGRESPAEPADHAADVSPAADPKPKARKTRKRPKPQAPPETSRDTARRESGGERPEAAEPPPKTPAERMWETVEMNARAIHGSSRGDPPVETGPVENMARPVEYAEDGERIPDHIGRAPVPAADEPQAPAESEPVPETQPDPEPEAKSETKAEEHPTGVNF